MVYAVLTTPVTATAELKLKIFSLSCNDDLRGFVLKSVRDKVNPSALFLNNGNRLSLNEKSMETYELLGLIESQSYTLKFVSADKEKFTYVFQKS